MNDWAIGKFLRVVLAIQLAMLGVIGLDTIGLEIPIIRQFISFTYLTFIPGILILRVLKLHKLGNIETVLYSVGLSIAFLMFTGLYLNTVYPLFGISRPISLVPLTITISITMLVLCVLSYVRDKDFSDSRYIDIKNIFSPPTLFLCLLPFLAIFGTYRMNFYHDNILIIALIIVIALVALSIGFDKFPTELYPLAVFIIAVSLLFHQSLISMYISGYDIQYEYYLCNLVEMNSIWDSTIPRTCNAMLSIVMLAPIYSIILNMEITWVFKIVYPLLFSLVPLGLYRVFKKQTNDKIAFLSCFFFMSIFTFYGEMPTLARQEIAELFFVLLILLMIDKNMDYMKRMGLFIIFAFSLAVSHYGLSYIFMFSIIAVCSMFFLNRWYKNQDNMTKIIITYRFVALYITFAIAWYIYVSNSSAFNAIVDISDHIISSIFTEFLNPEVAEGWYLLLAEPQHGLLHEINRIINYLNQIFITIGCVVLLKPKGAKFERDYATFSMVNLSILFASIAVPFFASSLNMVRVYQITLIFLAPFCVIGGIIALKSMSKIVRVHWINKNARTLLKILSIYFAIFFLYETGLVFYVAEERSTSIAIGNTIDSLCFNDQEVLGVTWLLNGVKDSDSYIYADEPRWLLLCSRLGWVDQHIMFTPDNINWMPEDSYIYLGTRNVAEHNVTLTDLREVTVIREYIDPEYIVDDRSKNYANGGCEIYK